MSKYEPLGQFLGKLQAEHWRPTFHELERLLGFDLPASARKRETWWANEAGAPTNPARAWIDNGWTVEKADLEKGVVSFVKKAQAAVDGVTEPGRAARVAADLKASAQSAKDWAEERADKAADLVRARPGLTISVGAGLAFAAGIAIGLMLVPRTQSWRDRAADLAHDRAEDALRALRSGLGRLPSQHHVEEVAHSRTEDAIHAIKEGLKGLPVGRAADIARERAEDALHALRDGIKDLRAAAVERFGR